MASSSTITAAEFKEALGRYPKILSEFSKTPKEGEPTLEELDKYRYEIAPSSFSKSTGRTMQLTDVQKLLSWKLQHGIYRPTLGKLVASNSDEKVADATKAGFSHYDTHPTEIKEVIAKLTAPLKGVGPATASLLLSIYDPANVVFFSDEVYRWLLHGGKKVTPKYTTAEFDEIVSKSKAFMARIKCTPIDLEKAAFVIIKEAEPVHIPAPKYVPSGKPRGRPAMAEEDKKKHVPSGKPRGRPAMPEGEKKTPAPSGKPRGRPASKPRAIATPTSPKAKAAKAAKAPKTEGAEPKKRGRPAKNVEATPATPSSTKKRSLAADETTTPASKKRGRPASAKSSTKKAKI